MVDLLPTPEQSEISEALARYLDTRLALDRLIGSRDDPAAHPDRLAEIGALGWLAIGLPEAQGGAGLSLVEEVLVLRQFGRVLAPPRLLCAILGARLALATGQHDLAQRVASGLCALALAVPAGSPDGDHYLIDCAEAELALRIDAAGARLVDIARLTGVAVTGLDGHVGLCRVTLDPAAAVADHRSPRWQEEAAVLAAAYLGGIGQAVCTMASAYAGLRHQFGQPIGAFQAVKHRCADMAIRAEAVGAQVSFAALTIAGEQPDAAFQALAAGIVAASYAILSAQDNIQLHGAIGTTAELPAHLYLKRAHLMDMAFGTARAQKAALLACPAAQWGAA